MNTVCPGCDDVMVETAGCTIMVLATEGVPLERIVYGDESYFAGERAPRRRCHDCQCDVGQVHHCACDFEQCPGCGGQALGCDCRADAGGSSCATHGEQALAVHRTRALAFDPPSADPDTINLAALETICLDCHAELDAARA